jgi:type IV pilus assembly protein PilC
MNRYKYKAINNEGKVSQGKMEADSPSDLENRLKNIQLELISHKALKRSSSILSKAKINRQELITFCFQTHQLLDAGVPLIDTLQDLRDGAEEINLKTVISTIIESIEGGKTLSDALRSNDLGFDDVFISLVYVGEKSGQLSKILANLAVNIKTQDDLAKKTKSVMRYPLIMGVVLIGVIFGMMMFLVPQLVTFLEGMGKELPGYTIALIETSNFVSNYWYLILTTPVGLYILFKLAHASNARIRYLTDALKLKLPLLGSVQKKLILTRFCNYFAMMFESGLPLLECLEYSEGISGNLVIQKALRDARQQISEGGTIGDSFENTGMFPPLILRMIRVGEKIGHLDKALVNVSTFYDQEVQEEIDGIQGMIGPAMTVLMASVLGWVMIAVMGPIYDIIGDVNV